MIESSTSVTLLYTDATKFELNARQIAITTGQNNKQKFDLKKVEVGEFGAKLQITKIQCEKINRDAEVAESQCIFLHGANIINDRKVVINTAESKLTFENPRSYNYFGDYQPIYIDFDENYLAVKARTPVATNADGATVPSKEAVLVYNRKEGATQQLIWGLTPDQYFFYPQAGMRDTKFEATTSLPIVVSETIDGATTTGIRFSQNPANLPPPQPSSSSSSSSSPTSSETTSGTSSSSTNTNSNPQPTLYKRRMFKTITKSVSTPIRDANDFGLFKGFVVGEPALTIVKKLYKNSQDDAGIVINDETGAEGVTGTEVKVNAIFDKPLPDNSAGTSTSTSDDSTTSTTSGKPWMPWWGWVIIGMIIFLIATAFLLRCLTKVKDDEEEEDIYYDTKQREDMAGDNMAKAKDFGDEDDE